MLKFSRRLPFILIMIEAIARTGTAMTQGQLRSEASVSVAKQMLDGTRLQGQQALKLIASAAAPPAPQDGRGLIVSTYA